MKQHWKTNTLVIVLIALIVYMVNISWSQAYYTPQPPNHTAEQINHSDSLKALREYRSSQHYKDSVTADRKQRTDSMIAARLRLQDSVKLVRQQLQDSMKEVRLAQIAENRRILDSAKNARLEEQSIRKAEIQKRKDSLTAIRDYRSSKQYKDSIATERKQRQDSIIAVRTHTQDSLRAIQTAFRDSMKVEREKANEALKASIDSMRTERQKMMDSLATIRQERKDSLASIRSEREAAKKLKEEEKEEERKLKIALEIQKKQDAFTNEDFRKKKWAFPRSIFQNLFTRYNYWFNTNEKLREIENNIERIHKDEFNDYIPLFVVDPERYKSQLAGEMDSLIQRASVGIQIHDPRSKWQDDLYMIVGKAYYYKQDYENAQSAFRYVIAIGEEIKKEYLRKHPKWKYDPAQFSMPSMRKNHVPARNEAILWLAKSMAADNELNKAIGLLQMVQNESQFPENLRGQLELELANIYLNRGQAERAIEPLLAASERKQINKKQKNRIHFLLAQIYQEQNNFYAANQHFQKLSKGNIPLDLDFHAKHQFLWNQINMDVEVEKSQDALANLAKEGKFHEYSDIALLSLGKSYALQKDYPKAINALKDGISKSQNPLIQSESQTLLGDYEYESLNYKEALIAYEEALTTLNPEEQSTLYARASNRNDALKELVPHYEGLYNADSLFTLMNMDERDQRKQIKDRIRDLKQDRRDSLNLAAQQSAINPAMALNQRQNTNQGSNAFYFDNPQLVQQGLQEFKQKWGNRPLQDQWRSRAQSTSGQDAMSVDDQDLVLQEDEDGIPTEAYLMSQIPSSQEEKDKVINDIEVYLFLLAKSYYTQVEDYPLAYDNFQRLIKEYPNSQSIPEAYYYLYLISDKHKNLGDKGSIFQEMKQSIGENHRLVLQIQESIDRKQNTPADTQDDYELFYDELYELSQKGKYQDLLTKIKEHRDNNVNFNEYEAHVVLLKIIGEIGIHNIEDAKIELEMFIIERNEQKELVDIAESILEMLENNTSFNSNQVIQSIQEAYIHDANAPFEVIIKLSNSPESLALKNDINNYNLMSSNFGLNSVSMQSLTAQDNLIIISDFENLSKAKAYINTLQRQNALFQQLNNMPYFIRSISKDNLQKLLYIKDWEEYEQFYNKKVNQ